MTYESSSEESGRLGAKIDTPKAGRRREIKALNKAGALEALYGRIQKTEANPSESRPADQRQAQEREM
jgi:hypothetical protein